MGYITSESDFELFEATAKRLLDKLNLTDIDVFFIHETSIPDSLAGYRFQYTASKAVLFLSKEWNVQPTEELIRRQAMHEVLHILLGRLSVQASDRSFDVSEFTSTEHQVINRLIILIMELDNEQRN